MDEDARNSETPARGANEGDAGLLTPQSRSWKRKDGSSPSCGAPLLRDEELRASFQLPFLFDGAEEVCATNRSYLR